MELKIKAINTFYNYLLYKQKPILYSHAVYKAKQILQDYLKIEKIDNLHYYYNIIYPLIAMGAAEIIPFNDKSYITLIPSESIQKLNMDSDIILNVDKDKIQNGLLLLKSIPNISNYLNNKSHEINLYDFKEQWSITPKKYSKKKKNNHSNNTLNIGKWNNYNNTINEGVLRYNQYSARYYYQDYKYYRIANYNVLPDDEIWAKYYYIYRTNKIVLQEMFTMYNKEKYKLETYNKLPMPVLITRALVLSNNANITNILDGKYYITKIVYNELMRIFLGDKYEKND